MVWHCLGNKPLLHVLETMLNTKIHETYMAIMSMRAQLVNMIFIFHSFQDVLKSIPKFAFPCDTER